MKINQKIYRNKIYNAVSNHYLNNFNYEYFKMKCHIIINDPKKYLTIKYNKYH